MEMSIKCCTRAWLWPNFMEDSRLVPGKSLVRLVYETLNPGYNAQKNWVRGCNHQAPKQKSRRWDAGWRRNERVSWHRSSGLEFFELFLRQAACFRIAWKVPGRNIGRAGSLQPRQNLTGFVRHLRPAPG